MARLPLNVDSNEVLSAAINLDRLADAAISAGYAAERLDGPTARLAASERMVSVEIERNIASLQRQMIAEDSVAAAHTRTGTAVVGLTNRMHGMSMGAGNIAAQFQDIAVTSAMGMNALTIGLQQGVQISHALQTMAGEGGTLNMLRSAFLSIISPMSLMTIGLVTVAAVAIQAGMSFVHLGETASGAIDRIAEKLKPTVEGYKDAEAALKAWQDASKIPPAELAQSNISKTVKDAEAEVDAFQRKAANVASTIPIFLDQKARDAAELMRGMLRDYAAGNLSARDLQTNLGMLANTDLGFLDFQIKGLLKDMAEGAGKAAAFGQSLRVMSEHALIATAHDPDMQVLLDARKSSSDSAASHQLEMDSVSARSPGQLAEIARRRETIALMNVEMNDTLRQQKIDEAGAEAAAKASYAISEAQRQRLEAANDNISVSQTELSLIGKGIAETTRTTFVRNELAAAEKEAAKNGISVSQTYIDQIETIGEKYGELKQQIAEGGALSDLMFERSTFGKSSVENGIEAQLRKIYGEDTTGPMATFLRNQLRINAAMKDFDDVGRSTVSGFVNVFADKLIETGNILDAFGAAGAGALEKIGQKFLDYASEGIWDWLASILIPNMNFSTGFLGSGGNGIGIGSMALGRAGAANGAVVSGSSLSAYSNSIVTQPTTFAFAKGMGIMGEEPNSPGEAIMPLRRGADGRLGVHASSDGRGAANQNHFSPTFHISGLGLSEAQVQRAISGALSSYRRDAFHDDVEKHNNDRYARG